MSPTIIRVEKNRENPYVMIRKSVFEDERLSWKAKGLMGYLLSRPDDWQVRVDDLVNRSKDGVDSVRAGLKELETYGYVETIRRTDEKGRVTHWEKIVYENPKEPDRENPDVENPDVESPDVENPTLLSNKELKTKKTNKKINNNKKKTAAVVDDEIKGLKRQIESRLGKRIDSLTPKLKQWVDEYGEDELIRKAEWTGSRKSKLKNIVGFFRDAVENEWPIDDVADAVTPKTETQVKQRDERYTVFYDMFPDA